MNIRQLHPFPARMAPEIALARISSLPAKSVVLDPMTGSGTVLQVAAEHGHQAIGLDLDPLAVMISRVSASRVDADRFLFLVAALIRKAQKVKLNEIQLLWWDKETRSFIDYWFAAEQRRSLTRIAYVLAASDTFQKGTLEEDAVRIAVSKLIITKESGASLARDVSHSRPHRVADDNDFDVFWNLERVAQQMAKRFKQFIPPGEVKVRRGDSRRMAWIRDAAIDQIITSPPYLNAIDYMRGHRMSLVWLGYSFSELREVRTSSIGAERAPDGGKINVKNILVGLGSVSELPDRQQRMVQRYAIDLLAMAKQVSRVLRRGGEALFVVGNSRLQDVFISNSGGVTRAAEAAGLKLISESERELPLASRYLPVPKDAANALSKRMRTETILEFRKVS